MSERGDLSSHRCSGTVSGHGQNTEGTRWTVIAAHPTELAGRQLMVRVAVVLCVKVPDVPLNVSECCPVLAFPLTVIVTVACAELVPLSVTEVGEIVQVVWLGTPLQESETLPVKSPSDESVSV
jgi:hypothetical protein